MAYKNYPFLVFAIFLSVLGSTSALLSKNFTESTKAVEQFAFKLQSSSNIPSITFGIAVKGKPLWSHAWGYSDLENLVKAKVTTRYRLARFTTALLGTLVDRNLVHFNDSVHAHLKESDFPRKTWKGKPVDIKISQLLSHRAGVVSYQYDIFDNLTMAHNVTECIHKSKDLPLIFEPGTAFAYSNYGFQLLGAVIESITKRPYSEVMDEFLHKHGLNLTLVETIDTGLIHDRAKYYRSPNENATKVNIPAPLFDELFMAEAMLSDGNVVSNVVDMLKYGQLLVDSYHGRKDAILTHQTITEMWTSHTSGLSDRNEPISPPKYGYAWEVETNATKVPEIPFPLKHHHFVRHCGSATGLIACFQIYPEEEIVAVAMSNKGHDEKLENLLTFAAEVLFDFAK